MKLGKTPIDLAFIVGNADTNRGLGADKDAFFDHANDEEGFLMAVYLAPGWEVELGFGREWLFVSLIGPESPMADATGIAESLELLMEQEVTHQMVLELHHLNDLPRDLMKELFDLHDAAAGRHEVVRVCGLPDDLVPSLRVHDQSHRFTMYQDRAAAVEGFFRPRKAR